MHKQEFVIEKGLHKILCDFEIPTDHQNTTKRSDQELIYKKKRIRHQVDFAVSSHHGEKIKENKKFDKYLDTIVELKKKAVKHEDYSDTNRSWNLRNGPQIQEQRQEELEIIGKVETIQTSALI